jgi:hypothetical protein
MSKLKEVINFLVLKDRFQWSKAAEDTSDFLHNVIAEIAVHGRSKTIKLQQADATDAFGFTLPKPWGLTSAQVHCERNGQLVFQLKSELTPLMVATNSEPCHGKFRVQTGLTPATEPSFVLHNPLKQTLTEILRFATTTRNICGVLTSSSSKKIENRECRGRLELHGAKTTVLNITHSEYLNLISKNVDECCLRVDVQTENESRFSILEYVFNSRDESNHTEIWLCAHLCHPKPGANDNASGVGTMIEIIKRLEGLPKSTIKGLPIVKIIMSPEFTGMAQYLKTANRLPSLVINVDTVGANKSVAGKDLTLELPPTFITSDILKAFVTHMQIAGDESIEFKLCLSPFKGYSDHALFAANCFEIPAVMLAQEKDIFNHTDHDTIDNLDFDRIQWIAEKLFRFLTSKNLPKSCTDRKLIQHQPSYSSLPFNFFKLLAALQKDDLNLIKNSFQSNKKTFAILQHAWILSGKGLKKENIQIELRKISDSEPELKVDRLISIIEKTIRGLDQNAV